MLVTVVLVAAPVHAQPAAQAVPPSSQEDQASSADRASPDLPVNLEKIKAALQQPPALTMRSLDERPMFRVQIQERQKIEELLAALKFEKSSTPPPPGGVYMAEMQRQWWPAVDNPSHQPFGAFSQGELLTILIENLAGKYLGGRALNAVSSAERAHAESAARDEVQRSVQEYCAAQPNGGAGISICSGSLR